MELSRSLLKKFANITNDSAVKATSAITVYGTAVVQEEKEDLPDVPEEVNKEGSEGDEVSTPAVKKIKYVRIDGSDILTPVSEATDIQDGDRVMVSVQNHVATVIGNVTCPSSARTATELEPVLEAAVASIGVLEAGQVTTGYLESNYAKISQLEAVSAQIGMLEAGQVTTKYLEANYAQIDLANIKAGSITTAMIGTGVVGSAQIADGSITDAKIVGLTANKITSGILDAGTIEVVNLNAANITVGTINGQQIAPGAVDLSKLSDTLSASITNAVNEASLAQAAANGKNTVFYQGTMPSTSGRIVNDTWFDTSDSNRIYYWTGMAWTARQFGTNAIADAAIQSAKIGSLDASKITTGTLNAARIGASSITAANLAANCVTVDKVSANAITSAKIAANAITSDKIVADAITTDKLAAKCVTATEIASNAITTDKLAASAVTAEKLSAGAVTAEKINVTDLFSQNITATNLHIKGNSSFEGKVLATNFQVNQKFDVTNGRLNMNVSEGVFEISAYFGMIENTYSNVKMESGLLDLSAGKKVYIFSPTMVNIDSEYNVLISSNGYIDIFTPALINIKGGTVAMSGSVSINGCLVEATAWTNCTISSGFTAYTTGYSEPKVRRICGIVSLQGILKNNSQITASNNETYMFTIPAGFRPSRALNLVQQGSGTMRWLMCVNKDGRVSIARYSNTTANQNVPAGSWLNCFATWMLD